MTDRYAQEQVAARNEAAMKAFEHYKLRRPVIAIDGLRYKVDNWSSGGCSGSVGISEHEGFRVVGYFSMIIGGHDFYRTELLIAMHRQDAIPHISDSDVKGFINRFSVQCGAELEFPAKVTSIDCGQIHIAASSRKKLI